MSNPQGEWCDDCLTHHVTEPMQIPPQEHASDRTLPINHENKYHSLMNAVKRSRLEHGDCKSSERYNGKPLACTACMAELYIKQELQDYRGRQIVSE